MKSNFKEKDFQSLFTKYMKVNGFTCAYELKVSKGGTIHFSKFEDQQLPALERVEHGILHHKMTDASLGLKPFDGFCLRTETALVGAMFHVRTQLGQTKFYMLGIDEVMKIKKSGAKSLKLSDFQIDGITINL